MNWSRMHFLVSFEHLYKLGNLLRSCFSLLGSLNPEQNGVSIPTIESSEEFLGPRITVQCGLEVTWHCCLTGRIICCVPAAVIFGALNFSKPGSFHLSLFD